MGIVASVLQSFHGGVHPAEHKALSEHCAIESLPMPKRLYVPLDQHIGKPCEPCVTAGDLVLKGQLIGKAQGFVSAPVHAPTSGTVLAVEEHAAAHPSGMSMLCVVIEPDGMDKWVDNLQGIEEPLKAEPDEIRKKIQDAGVVGLGGAAFPSFIKMSPPRGRVAELLLINGVECEPYLTCDARIMEERARYIIAGITIMMRALQVKECIIGIESNKPGAIRTMRNAAKKLVDVRVQSLPVMYPQGAEKQLIEVVTGRQVPSGGLPIDVGVIVHNVATAAAIRDAVKLGRPLIERVVTVTGKGIVKPANLECLIGTPVSDLVDYCGGLKAGVRKLVMGGPMMGTAMQHMDVPIVKGTSGILALSDGEVVHKPEQPCIRCGSCIQVCPISLIPCEMAWFSRSDQFEALSEIHLFDCIECGSCAYVCPSSLPLVQYFRYGKASIQADQHAQKQMEISKARTKAKEARVEREKAAKERKKAEMKAKMLAKKKAAEEAKKAEAAASGVSPAESPASTEASAPAEGDEQAAKAARVAKAAKAAKAARAARAARAAKAAESGHEVEKQNTPEAS